VSFFRQQRPVFFVEDRAVSRVVYGAGRPERETEVHMALDLSLFNNSVSTLLDHLTRHYGEDAKLETYVICARVRSATMPGGSGINWIVNPGDEELAGGLLREVLKAVEGNGDLS
jgi:hypothetical protein